MYDEEGDGWEGATYYILPSVDYSTDFDFDDLDENEENEFRYLG